MTRLTFLLTPSQRYPRDTFSAYPLVTLRLTLFCPIFYNPFLDLDPCLGVTCDFGLCKAFGPYDARCVCLDKCPSYQKPLCSSNGTTYDNECLFEQEMCLLRQNFTVQHPGSCKGVKPLFYYLFRTGYNLPAQPFLGRLVGQVLFMISLMFARNTTDQS